MLTIEMVSSALDTYQAYYAKYFYVSDLIKSHHNHTKLVHYLHFAGKETELWEENKPA